MHGFLLVALVVSWVLVFVLAGLLYLLVVQHGRALVRLNEIDEYFMNLSQGGEPGAPQAERRGLEVGTEAPEFALPDLAGEKRRLRDYRGAPLVLAFFNPRCGYCLKMSEQLGRLPADAPTLLVLTQGEIEENRRLQEAHGWRCDVVHEDDWKVVQAYGSFGTPSAYLIDSDGRIASELAVGADAVLALLDGGAAAQTSGGGESNGHAVALDRGAVQAAVAPSGEASPRPLRTRDVSESRLVRDGLEAGTLAPTFVLPDLEGTMRSLTEFRGRRVLLVFSDVHCGPCEELAPKLVELHGSRPGELDIVMISRGDPEENRLKASVHGYPFPVVLQKRWEVSKEYGMFATPIAYLIDEEGVIVEDVAVGSDAILALAAH